MEFLTGTDFRRLSNPGVVSLQLVAPHNSASARVTITRVTVQPGAGQPRHKHDASEQIWIALEGAGEVARFAEGDVHGVENTKGVPFAYLSVTSPPIDFGYAYQQKG